jgi:hypothetical protein
VDERQPPALENGCGSLRKDWKSYSLICSFKILIELLRADVLMGILQRIRQKSPCFLGLGGDHKQIK